MTSINLYFVRHGQAQHNLLPSIDYPNPYLIEDPILTEKGKQQSLKLQQSPIYAQINFDAVYCSPLLRCIQTTDILINNEIIYLDDKLLEYNKDIRELSNKRKEKSELKKIISNNNTYNLDLVSELYLYHNETESNLINRIHRFLKFILLSHNISDNILIVTHHDWLINCFIKYNIITFGVINNCELYHIQLKKPNDNDKIQLFNERNYMKVANTIVTYLSNLNLIPNITTMLLSNQTIIDIVSQFKDLECNYTLIKNIYNSFTKEKKELFLNQFSFYTQHEYKQEYPIIFIYYYYLNKYFNLDYKIFSLGDSLDKLNTFWNLVNQNNIIIIPFSGSSFDDIDIEKSTIVFNNEIFIDMMSKFNNLLQNNNYFKNLIDTLERDEKVLITDFMLTGKSFATIILLLQQNNINIKKLYFLYITYNDDINILLKNACDTLKFPIENIKIVKLDRILNFYYTNSEKSNSRCIPKYSVKQWDKDLKDIYYDGLEPNYFNCNLHKILYYISSICFYNNFVVKHFNEIEDSDFFINLDKLIKDFIQMTTDNNSLVGIKMKYLKYKSKYLKLKQNNKKLYI
jgi:broad specificity phosphatase PhoE